MYYWGLHNIAAKPFLTVLLTK